MSGDRCRREHPLGPRDRGAVEAGESARNPRHLRSDNGPEFVSRKILRWISDEKIETALIDPGKPWQNGSNESFNGKFRDECLGMQWFQNRTEAKVLIEMWRREYNTVRPHSSLGDLTPAEFAERSQSTQQIEAVF
jgi:putative transposase